MFREFMLEINQKSFKNWTVFFQKWNYNSAKNQKKPSNRLLFTLLQKRPSVHLSEQRF